MARVIVRLHGEEVTRLTLESGIEYIAGRAQDAQIHLAVERGISRHHLKFFEQNGVWMCQTLSKFTLIQRGGNSVEILELNESCSFSVPPYEFTFETGSQPQAAAAAEGEEEHAGAAASAPEQEKLPAFYQPRVGDPAAHPAPEDTSPRVNNEATVAGVPAKLVPYFRISYPNTADDEVIKLEGHLWVAGRDSNCELPIDSPHISRKHFELARTKEGFFLTDLGSSNGTKLNGNKIPPHEPTQINSGDELEIKGIVLTFEIRDANFANRVEAVAALPALEPMFAQNFPVAYLPPGADDPTELNHGGRRKRRRSLREMGTERLQRIKGMDRKKLIIRGAIAGCALVMIIMSMTSNEPKETAQRDPAKEGGTSVSFDKLTVEQRSIVKDSFNLARNLYVQGKYQLCLTELAKLHELIPLYENSKELDSFCKQGVELEKRQRDLERKERERLENEQRISSIVENCKANMSSESTVEETRMCLAPAMEFDPEHHMIVEMIHSAQMREEERKFNLQRKREVDHKASRGVEHYRKAEELENKGQLANAVAEYERFINTPYPRSEENKSKARRAVASIKEELRNKISSLLEQCRSLADKGNYKEAYAACDKAVTEDPKNSEAKSKRDQMVSELKQQLKSVYEDSVLEESLGNVDSAKEKWKKIVAEDIPNGEYAKKAKHKLQSHGVGR